MFHLAAVHTVSSESGGLPCAQMCTCKSESAGVLARVGARHTCSVPATAHSSLAIKAASSRVAELRDFVRSDARPRQGRAQLGKTSFVNYLPKCWPAHSCIIQSLAATRSGAAPADGRVWPASGRGQRTSSLHQSFVPHALHLKRFVAIIRRRLNPTNENTGRPVRGWKHCWGWTWCVTWQNLQVQKVNTGVSLKIEVFSG